MCGFSVLPWSGPPKCAGSPRDSRSRPSLWVEVGHQGGGGLHQAAVGGGGGREMGLDWGGSDCGSLRTCGGSGPGNPGPQLAGARADPPNKPAACLLSAGLPRAPWQSPRGPSGGGTCLGSWREAWGSLWGLSLGLVSVGFPHSDLRPLAERASQTQKPRSFLTLPLRGLAGTRWHVVLSEHPQIPGQGLARAL